ncbi:DNA adenine methylase [Sphaerisporangium sp. NPDC088356]|uniref:DNA adenine methylase n=1 Tax=Sphaerisporangium sp. NPDC088356 TaxID=3154871 RepID=UPI003423D4DD
MLDDHEGPIQDYVQGMSAANMRTRDVKRPIVSPLRYPGGKSSLYSRLRAIVRANNLTTGTYVEPYAGGAGAALGLLATGQVRRIVINDLDPAIFAFWTAVVKFPAEFSELINRVDLTVDEWVKQKSVYAEAPRDDYLRLGFATFFLNRTNRSGVLNGGPIGGMDQTGNYKIDARFNRSTLVERIRIVGLHANRITVSNLDGMSVIKRYSKRANTLIYADPPYFEKAGSLYMNSFKAGDHAALADCLNGLRESNWLLTYDNAPEVETLYANRRREVFSLGYSAHRVVKAKEIMVFSDKLEIA